jgi:HEAT repeat protein
MSQGTRDIDTEDFPEGLGMAERYEAMLGLGGDGRLLKETLERLCLHDEEPFIRKRALRILAVRREKGYLDILRKALQDSDPMVRIVAAEQLHYQAKEGKDIRLGECFKPLLRDSDPTVRSRIVSLLVNSDEKQKNELVLDLFFDIVDSTTRPEDIQQIATFVSMLRDRRIPKLLRKRLDRLDEEKRMKGIKALEQEGMVINQVF